jgi:paraquat-inducible protein A
MTGQAKTSREFGLLPCHECGIVSKPSDAPGTARCPRCNARLHLRKPYSEQRSWAYLIAALIMYIPANFLPMMITSTVSGTREDTIISGIRTLWEEGSWGIAAVVFFASVTVPILKMIALTLLLVSVRMRAGWMPKQRTRLYRLIRWIGRWSMLDIYVVALLTSLVQFSFLANVKVGPAAFPFGAVVVLTIIAVLEFDPRLIWDSTTNKRNEA